MGTPEPRRLLKKLKTLRKSGKYEIYFEDECHFQRSASIIRSWFMKGTTPEIKSPAVKEKISIMGAVGADNGQLVTMETDIFNADSFKEFVAGLIRKAKTNKKILLVLDNARFHHARINRNYLKSVKKKIELLYLPAYSPELNPIESFWKMTRRGVTHNRYFESLEQERSLLKSFFKKYERPNMMLMRLSAIN
jgi:transposase